MSTGDYIKKVIGSARKKDAAATRAALLRAAQLEFSRVGYDAASTREIAASAGANPALINRYFGGKEGLFEAAIAARFTVEGVLPDTREGFAAALAHLMLHKDRSAPDYFDPTLAMLRSIGNAQAAALMRTGIDDSFVAPLAKWVGGADAEARSALLVAVLSGMATMRDALEVGSLRRDEAAVEEWLRRILALLLEDTSAPATAGGPVS